MSSHKSQVKIGIYIALLIFAADQISKLLVTHYLKGKVAVLPHLNFVLAHNRGAAFGILSDSGGWQRWMFIAIGLVITVIIIGWLRRSKISLERLSLALILGGAWGNLLDRMVYGHVIDFIDFYIGSWHWYTFNIADCAICIGAVFLALTSFRK